jgi:hypothetical protein
MLVSGSRAIKRGGRMRFLKGKISGRIQQRPPDPCGREKGLG